MKKLLLFIVTLNINNGYTSTLHKSQNEDVFFYSSSTKIKHNGGSIGGNEFTPGTGNQRNNAGANYNSAQAMDILEDNNNAADSDIFSDSNSHGNFNDGLIGSPLDRGPYFDITASKNVTALVAKTAYLNCRVRNLANKTVSWIRHRDLHLLTVGKNTYTSDQRFQSVHNPQTGDWSLQVRYPQQRDSGVYECQVSTTPPVGHSMLLSVVEPITTIVGSPDLYIDTGSTVNLTCIVRHLPEPPPVIYWTHNNEEINYDSPRGGVSVITEKGDITTSYLLIQRAKIADSGKYTCSPSTANPQTVNVHILNGEQPAAIQRGNTMRSERLFTVLFVTLSLVIIQR